MLNRILGVLMLKAPVYREIADDTSATGNAALIVIVMMLISGFLTGLIHVERADAPSTIDLIGVREAAEFSTGKAILTAVIAVCVEFLIVAVLGGAVVGSAAVLLHIAR